jgi:hypothetical protein
LNMENKQNMNKQAADDFISWLSNNSDRIRAVCAEMQSSEFMELAPKQKMAKVQKLFH